MYVKGGQDKYDTTFIWTVEKVNVAQHLCMKGDEC